MMIFHTYTAFLPLRFLAAVLPRPIALAISRWIAVIAFLLMGRTRRTIRNNWRILGRTPSAADILATFVRYARFLVDSAFLPRYTDRTIGGLLAGSSGEALLDRSLARGKGCVIVSCHLGNWEVGGALLASRCRSLTALALRFPGGRIVAYREALRARFGVRTIYLEDPDSSGEIYAILRRGGAILMLADRDYTTSGLAVPFGAATLSYPIGPAILSRITGADILAAACVMEPGGRYRAMLKEVPSASTDADRDAAVGERTRAIARIFEEMISAHPDQWFNFDRERRGADGRSEGPRPASRR